MKKLPRGWKVFLIFILLLLPIEHLRKKNLIVGRWRPIGKTNILERKYFYGGDGIVSYQFEMDNLSYREEMVEKYRIITGMFLVEKLTHNRLTGQVYPPPDSGVGDDIAYSRYRIYMDALGKKMTLCSKNNCFVYEKY